MPTPPASETASQITGTGCLVRMTWMVVGNAVLAICAVLIAAPRSGFLTPADAVFWAALLAVIAIRHVDITRLGGQTASGEPATLRHWRRYAFGMTGVAAAVWAAAHLAAHFR